MFVFIIIFIAFFIVIPFLTGKLFFPEGPTAKAWTCFSLSWVLGFIVLSAPQKLEKPKLEKPMTFQEFKAQSERRIGWWTNHLADRYIRKIKDKTTCQAFIHKGAFNVLEEGDLDEIVEIKNLCVWDDEFLNLYDVVGQSVHKEIFIVAHGTQNEYGSDSFADGLLYNDLREIARKKGKQIAILSCRGSSRNNDLYFKYKFETFEIRKSKAFIKESRLPHLENGLWVYGESGYLTGSDLKAQYRGWRQQMSMIK